MTNYEKVEDLAKQILSTKAGDYTLKQLIELAIKAEKKERPVIKSVIKAESGMVLVFDEAGEQIPEYQGQYQKVKPSIIKDAPPSTVFNHALQLHDKIKLKIVSREEW